MQFYEANLVDDDVFLQWGGDTILNEFSVQVGVGYEALEGLRTAAAPFLIWMEEAEEEEEGS